MGYVGYPGVGRVVQKALGVGVGVPGAARDAQDARVEGAAAGGIQTPNLSVGV